MRTDGRTDGRTDLTKLIVTFCKFAKAPKNIGSKLALAQHDTRTRWVLDRTAQTFAFL